MSETSVSSTSDLFGCKVATTNHLGCTAYPYGGITYFAWYKT